MLVAEICKQIMKKFSRTIFLIISFISILGFVLPVNAQSLTELQKRQAELDAQIQANKSAISSKQGDINDIQGLINNLNNQISVAEKDIDLSIRKIDLTSEEINQTQADIEVKLQELKVQKDNLFETVKVYYENSQTSTLEVVVASNNLNDAIDRTQYLEAISSRLNETVTKINQAKADLETQKKQQEEEKISLENQKNSLMEKKKGLSLQKSQKDTLLNQNVAEKSQYQATLSDLQKERSQISDAIYAQRRASGDISFGSSGYPYSAIDVPDAWGFLTRECTSYAAWYLNNVRGKRWVNTQPGRGSARYWDEIAATLNSQGGNWSVSQTPKVGAVVSWEGPLYAGDQWGHVAVVEGVNSDGTIDLSEFNWVSYSYSFRTHVNPGRYGSYVYIY